MTILIVETGCSMPCYMRYVYTACQQIQRTNTAACVCVYVKWIVCYAYMYASASGFVPLCQVQYHQLTACGRCCLFSAYVHAQCLLTPVILPKDRRCN